MRTVRSAGVHVRSFARGPEDREAPVSVSETSRTMKMRPCSTSTVASGRPMRRWTQPAGGDDAAEQDRHRDDGERIVAREERDQDAGEAVARGERGVGAALDRRDFEEAGEAGAGAGDQRAGHDQPADRQPLRERRAKIAAGDARREAEGRARHQHIERDGEQDADREAPVHVGAGNLADHIGVADRLGRGLVGIGRVAQRAFDEEIHDRDADIGQQQRGDRLVDAARVCAESRRAPIQSRADEQARRAP